MRSDLVVLPEPSIDNDLGLFGGVSASNANVVASYFELLGVLTIGNFELNVYSVQSMGFVG